MTADPSAAPMLGVVAASTLPPEEIPQFSQHVERLGFGELWFGEDCFYQGGIAAATAALSATSQIPIGLGVVSAVTRHPAILAMELATMARTYPGRLRPGIGLGLAGWMRQLGLMPSSPLTAVREAVESLTRLLSGEEVTATGGLFEFDRVRLEYPVEPRPDVYVGAIGPKMHELAGEVADATVAPVLSSPRYVRWVRERVLAGRARSARDPSGHRVATYAIFNVHRDRRQARASVRDMVAFYLGAMPTSAMTDLHGIRDELLDMHARGGSAATALIAREMPDSWLDGLAVAGEPDECAEHVVALLEAGSDCVLLCPAPAESSAAILEVTAAEVVPRVLSARP